MKLYCPRAICEDGYSVITHRGLKTFSECKKVFENWEKHWRLKSMWVVVTDTDDLGPSKSFDVRKDYILCERCSESMKILGEEKEVKEE